MFVAIQQEEIKKMIIVRLLGGLGNQLFQYAAARRLAHVNNVPLKLDISGFETYKLHKYSLQHFNIIEDFASAAEVSLCNRELNRSRISRLFSALGAGSDKNFKVIKEAHFHFDPWLLSAGDNVFLDGYWQSERYFVDIADLLRKELTFKDEPDGINRTLAEEIATKNSVALHIRRADYVSNEVTNSVLGVCSLDYYHRAVEEISTHINNPHFYIFSDDPDWVKVNIRFDQASTFLSHNDADKNYEDLRLMSLCKGNIIANSSFSWWGAWLNSNRSRTVIAPINWFSATSYNTCDLIPGSWIRL